MADFTVKSTVKSAVRNLASPIADYTTFNTLIQDILDDNPWGCTAYESGGVSHQGVEVAKESYAASIIYENAEAKTVGQIPVKGPTMTAVNTAVTQITGNATITGAMGAGVSASRDSSEDTFSKTLKCHASNGEFFMVSFKRDSISLTSYDADSIRTTLETWADGIAALA